MYSCEVVMLVELPGSGVCADVVDGDIWGHGYGRTEEEAHHMAQLIVKRDEREALSVERCAGLSVGKIEKFRTSVCPSMFSYWGDGICDGIVTKEYHLDACGDGPGDVCQQCFPDGLPMIGEVGDETE